MQGNLSVIVINLVTKLHFIQCFLIVTCRILIADRSGITKPAYLIAWFGTCELHEKFSKLGP